MLTLAAALLGAGCAHVPVKPPHDGLSFAQRRARLEAVSTWRLRGRLAVSTGKQGFQGSYSWLEDGRRLELSVHGPLGAGVLEIAGTPRQLTVTARGETRVLTDPETDLSRLLGWWIPVESLPDWLLGLPDPAFPDQAVFNGSFAIESLEQRQWRIEYTEYQLEQGLLLPRRIDMQHGSLELRLTVDAWEPAGAAPRAATPHSYSSQLSGFRARLN
ncbi:MAG TPA: lipoprotein insertase outer membrane protein LolB [Gammaproteobacteria bacterium]|nr:lipoprotein insertase outer membrane protein LolB [Gammaproteobacteria bacterium]